MEGRGCVGQSRPHHERAAFTASSICRWRRWIGQTSASVARCIATPVGGNNRGGGGLHASSSLSLSFSLSPSRQVPLTGIVNKYNNDEMMLLIYRIYIDYLFASLLSGCAPSSCCCWSRVRDTLSPSPSLPSPSRQIHSFAWSASPIFNGLSLFFLSFPFPYLPPLARPSSVLSAFPNEFWACLCFCRIWVFVYFSYPFAGRRQSGVFQGMLVYFPLFFTAQHETNCHLLLWTALCTCFSKRFSRLRHWLAVCAHLLANNFLLDA